MVISIALHSCAGAIKLTNYEHTRPILITYKYIMRSQFDGEDRYEIGSLYVLSSIIVLIRFTNAFPGSVR